MTRSKKTSRPTPQLLRRPQGDRAIPAPGLAPAPAPQPVPAPQPAPVLPPAARTQTPAPASAPEQAPLSMAQPAELPAPAPAPLALPLPAAVTPVAAPVWLCQHEAVVGLSHRTMQPPLPCQDAALARTQTHPLVVVADGAGSSAVSEIGAQAVVSGLARLLHTLERKVALLLDTPATAQHEEQARALALLLVKHARGLLDDLAATHRRALRDFRCTLLLAIVGREQLLWLKVGDGALVLQRQEPGPEPKQPQAPQAAPEAAHLRLQVLCLAGKGEFANQTQFLDDSLQPGDVQSALVPVGGVVGVAVMSDGAAEKLVSHDGQRVAGQLGLWLDALRRDRLPRQTLTRGFYSDSFCSGSTGDDCSLALLARTPG